LILLTISQVEWINTHSHVFLAQTSRRGFLSFTEILLVNACSEARTVPISGCCFLDFIVQRFFESVNNRESRLQRSTADAFDRPRAIHKVLFQGVVDVFEANCVRIFFTCTHDASTKQRAIRVLCSACKCNLPTMSLYCLAPVTTTRLDLNTRRTMGLQGIECALEISCAHIMPNKKNQHSRALYIHVCNRTRS